MQLKSAAQWVLALPVASLANDEHQQQIHKRALQTSEPHYPSPWMNPDADGWAEAYAQARDFVSQLTLTEKVNLTTGVG